MIETKSSYREAFKATSIFGGVQVFNILIGIARSKIIAVLLGASGYGFVGMLNAPVGFIANLTGLGINFSAIRDISSANEQGDQVKLSTTLKTFRRLIWVTGLMGMLTVLVFSPWLSQWGFGNKNYSLTFVFVSITLLINSISNGQVSVLRGTRRIKDMAKVGLFGYLFGLIASIPFYYYYGMKGIVPAIIISSCITLFISWFYSSKVKIVAVKVSYRESFQQGKQMVQLGVMMTLTSMISNGVSYLVITFINKMGGLSEVGLYNAGWAITNQYTGMVFAAMAADYYPRLAGIHQYNTKIRNMVNQQSEIAVLIIAPVMLLYLTSLPFLIPLFYSSQFMNIIPFTQWVILGMLFKTSAWAMAYIILAKGNIRLFFITETISNVFLLICNITGYYLFGLQGIGIGFVIICILYFFLVWIICMKKYEFCYNKLFYKIFIIQLFLCVIAFLIAYNFDYSTGYVSGGILLIISCLYSYSELNKRLDIVDIVQSKLKINRWKKNL